MECINIAENCRACRIKTEEESQKIFIFSTVTLPDIFKETTSLDIHENDELPKVLCSTCYDRLLEAYNFRKMCSTAALHFQKVLSMDVPEEKNTSSENLTHEISDSDASNCSPDRDASLTDISDSLSVDENLPETLKKDLDSDTSLVSEKSQKPQRNTNESPMSLKRKKSIHPEEPSGKKQHMEDVSDEEGQFTYSESEYDYHYDAKLGTLHMKKFYDPENFKLPRWTCERCDLEFKTVSALRNHCLAHGPSTGYVQVGFPLPSGRPNLRRFIEFEGSLKTHFCAICRVEKASDEELTLHMNTHLKEVTEEPLKTWTCEYCNYKFATEANMKRHLKCGKKCIKSSDQGDSQDSSEFQSDS